ncbi:MAG TPA: hypothetical protein VLC95_07370 [Anaerolineae bacterium]|nr:hypothetical protein [Anaerolineae bacterium]
MYRKMSWLLLVILFALVGAAPALADQPANTGGGLGNKAPNFDAGVFADGEAFGTKGTTTLPAPTAANAQSYDVILVFTNGAEGQLPVAEAAPGNPNYNGGRWTAYTATWIENLPHPKIVLTSYDDVLFHVSLGHIALEDAHNYFQCPLLPVK